MLEQQRSNKSCPWRGLQYRRWRRQLNQYQYSREDGLTSNDGFDSTLESNISQEIYVNHLLDRKEAQWLAIRDVP